MSFEAEMPVVPGVPSRFVYGPASKILPLIASRGDIVVGLVRERELLVKFPLVAIDQYSELLIDCRIASQLPPEPVANAST